MRYYFQLQYRFLNRRWRAFGLHPLVGYVLLTALFGTAVIALFSHAPDAGKLLLALALPAQWRIAGSEKVAFLKGCFRTAIYRQVRLVEHMLVGFPFLLALAIYSQWPEAVALVCMSLLFGFFRVPSPSMVKLPTPFLHRPFEFTLGFRRFLFGFFCAAVLAAISIGVGNPSLGMFALGLVYLMCMGFYGFAEDAFYIWIFAMTTRRFLWEKTKTAMGYGSLLAICLAVPLLWAFPGHWRAVAILFGLGSAFLLCIVMAKYAAWPEDISLPQGILVLACVFVPPFLLFVIPYFYHRALRRLQPWLS